MNNCSFRWKIYRLSLFFKEYVSIKNEFVEKMGHAPEHTLRYFGIGICGAKKKVNQLTGSMLLLR